MTLPNFLIIGSQKAGTTALYHYIKQHPQIFMSEMKEPCFFAFEGEELDFRSPSGEPVYMNRAAITTIDSYRRLFSQVTNQKAVGEASPIYLIYTKAAERIRYYVPHAKLIAILRDPADTAYACFLMDRRSNLEPLNDFAKALQDQERRIEQNCFGGIYLQQGFYYEHLRVYFDLFPPTQIRVYLYEDFVNDNKALLKDIFQFLAVDDAFKPDVSIRENVSGLPKSFLLHRLLTGRQNPLVRYASPYLPHGVRRFFINIKQRNLRNPALSPILRKELIETFREDIVKLQTLINRDLSMWLE